MSTVPRCFEREQLVQFVLGKLSDAERELVKGHLEHCKSCLQIVHNLDLQNADPPTDLPPVSGHETLILPDTSDSDAESRRYSKVRVHAVGGIGQVFVAWDREVNREVALKEMKPSIASQKDNYNRFLREAEITGRLEHPGVVPIYGIGNYADGRPFYAMRLIRGTSLHEAIEKLHKQKASRDTQPRLELRQLLLRFVSVCYAVDYAHSRGVVHRDLKPGNVMLGKHGETVVVDWGLAKAIGTSAAESIASEAPVALTEQTPAAETLPGSAVGTPSFMSPEQAIGQIDSVGRASDIFSLGATLYCILTGKPPFVGANSVEVLQKARAGEYQRVRELNPSVPLNLQAICDRGMARNPNDRYQSCEELAADIEAWLADEPVQAHIDSAAERIGRWARRHRSWFVGIAGILLTTLTALGVIVVLLQWANQRIQSQYTIAEEKRAEAVRLQGKADEERHRAEVERDQVKRMLYATDVNVAQRAWESGDRVQAISLLQRHIPEEGSPDYRGWEWHILWRLCHDYLAILENHAGSVSAMKFSGDGQLLAVGTSEGQIKIWNIAQRAEQRTMNAPPGKVRHLAFSADNQMLASTHQFSEVRVWNLKSGEAKILPRDFGQHVNARSCAFSPDGEYLATGSSCNTLWRIADLRKTFEDWNIYDSDVAFAPDGRTIVSVRGTGEKAGVYYVNAANQPEQSWVQLKGFDPGYGDLVSDGAQLAWVRHDRRIDLNEDMAARRNHDFLDWYLGASEPIIGFEATGMSIAGLPIGDGWGRPLSELTLAEYDRDLSSNSAPVVGLVDVAHGKVRDFTPADNPLAGNKLLAGRCVVRRNLSRGELCDAFTGQLLRRLPEIRSADFALDRRGHRVAVAGGDIVRLFSTSKPIIPRSIRTPAAIRDLTFLEHGHEVVLAGGRGVAVWDLLSGFRRRYYGGIDKSRSGVTYAISLDGKRAVCVSPLKEALEVVLVDPQSDTEIARYEVPSARPPKDYARIDVCLSPDGTLLAIGTRSAEIRESEGIIPATSTVRVVQFTARGELQKTIDLGSWPNAFRFQFSPDNSQLIVLSRKGIHLVKVSDTTDTKLLKPVSAASTFKLSPRGDSIAIGTFEGYILLIDSDGNTVTQLSMPGESVAALAFHPTEPRLASASLLGNIHLWDLGTGQELVTLRNDHPIISLAFSPDGVQLAAGSADGELTVWDATPYTPQIAIRAEAHELLLNLLATPLRKAEVLQELEKYSGISDAVRREAIVLAATTPETSNRFVQAAWQIIRKPGLPTDLYERALHFAETACQLAPKEDLNHIVHALVRYRLGDYNSARDELNEGTVPSSSAPYSIVSRLHFCVAGMIENKIGTSAQAKALFQQTRAQPEIPPGWDHWSIDELIQEATKLIGQ